VGDDTIPFDTQQRRPAHLRVIESPMQSAQKWSHKNSANARERVAAYLVSEFIKNESLDRLGEFQNDVSDKTVTNDNFGFSAQNVAALNIPHEIQW